ncbi:hypothetical protein J6590_057408 [Homalodisca vitripennis]|nr:hypothetical protein J6590_057408 [Homalodisca vitripennis]
MESSLGNTIHSVECNMQRAVSTFGEPTAVDLFAGHTPPHASPPHISWAISTATTSRDPLDTLPTFRTETMDCLIRFLLLLSPLSGLLAMPVEVPVFELAQPFWDNACGITPSPPPTDLIDSLDSTEDEQDEFSEGNISWHEQLAKSLQKVRHQLKTARELLVYKEFDKLYIEVRRGVLDRQYIPNWVPSKGDVEAILAVETFTANEIARYLPVLLTDLQKFAVAFEQIYRDEYLSYDYSPRQQALHDLIGTLKQTLCEIESALWSLDLSFGPAVGRTIMSQKERDVPDFTHRMIRDNGVLFKYRDYLSGWNRLIRVKQLIRALKK